ncbi:MAG: undecaprenyl-phosphate glucose phosphotransferase [Hyphomicrobiales bacterium]|nr:undecaprenyl-phosphate glucose phosphotransferase [Hyphomicrobiales bacterium]
MTGGVRSAHYIDPQIVQRLLKAADFIVLFTWATVLFLLSTRSTDHNAIALTAFLSLEIAFSTLLAMRWLQLYDVSSLLKPVRGMAFTAGVCFAAGALIAIAADMILFDVSLLWLKGWAGMCLVGPALSRAAAWAWAKPLAMQGAFCQRIAIVGGGQTAEEAINALEDSPGIDIEIVGLFDDRADKRSPASIKRHAKLGTVADLARLARSQRIDLIIVAIPLSAEARLLQMLHRLWELPVDIRISGQASKLKLSSGAYNYLGKLPLLPVFERPLSGWGWHLKNVMDKALAALMIAGLSPVMLATAAAIKLTSKGPAVFKQKRYGFNNEMVEVFKFRSMYTDRCDVNAVKLVTKDDPRVTPVGRFIRKTSIDELPQLFNVLTGQLSLVGPRPHATQAKAAEELYEAVVDGYFARHRVKPGITGWAQINGWRGETDTADKIENRVKFDLEYIDRWSLWFDLYIIIKTPFALLQSDNAY